LGLFAPQAPEPSRLDVTLARLKAIVGEERVGSAVLEDTHRPGSFHMEGFSLAVSTAEPKQARPRMALRRMRPPVLVRVAMRNLKPATFRSRENSFDVIDSYGPWKTAGCWWSTDRWNLEEWDVLAADSTGKSIACLLVYDCVQKEWRLEAHYD
jgi:protein ImuB